MFYVERGELGESATHKVADQCLCRKCHDSMYPHRAKSKLVISQEVFILGHLLHVPSRLDDESDQWIWDCPPNDCTRKKSDKLWLGTTPPGLKSALHLEIDEWGARHEDCDTRVADIRGGPHFGDMEGQALLVNVDSPSSIFCTS